MKVLVYGKSGQVASCVGKYAKEFGFECENFGREEAQIDDIFAINRALEAKNPDIIINAAAYNNVDGAEDNFDEAKRVNSIGPKTLAACATIRNIPIIHISTDYVFDGNKSGLYLENDMPNPINKYGESKLLGEQMVLAETNNCLILRVSWVFSEYSNNFVKSMLGLAKSGRKELSIVDDQIGIPTSSHDIAKAILTCAKMLIKEPQDSSIRGLFHYTSKTAIDRFSYAKYIFNKAKEVGADYCEISSIKSDEFPTKAKRPHSTPMSAGKFAHHFDYEIVDWQKSLDEIFDDIIKAV